VVINKLSLHNLGDYIPYHKCKEVQKMEKIITTSKGDFKVRELTIEEGMDLSVDKDPTTKSFEFTIKCLEPKLTLEEFKKFPFREGLKLIQAVNEVNGLADFQQPTTKS